jgi:hypothetical protein
MRRAALCLWLGAWLISGCASQRDDALKAYQQQMIAPGVEARTYLSLYTTHKARCESRGIGAQFNCTEAKVDLAHIERAWRSALPIAERMAQDTALTDADRKEAQEATDHLRAGIERIQSAKRGQLPQL